MARPSLNACHPVFPGGNYTLWLPGLGQPGGSELASAGRLGPGRLVGDPAWKSAYGLPGIKTDLGSYVDLSPGSSPQFEPTKPCTIALAYVHNFESSGTTETGALFSAGAGGVVIAANATIISAGKSNGTTNIIQINRSPSPKNGSLHTLILNLWEAGAGASHVFYYDGFSVSSGNNSAWGSSQTGATATCLGQDFPTATPNYGRHIILACLHVSGRQIGAAQAWAWHQAATEQFRPLFVQEPFYGDGLNHTLATLTGSATAGLGLGATYSPEPWTTQGIGLGSVGNLEPYTTQGFALGASSSPIELFGRAIVGMMFGSDPDEDRAATAGVGLGAKFTLDGQYASSIQGVGLGSRAVSDAGDLANGRYRR